MTTDKIDLADLPEPQRQAVIDYVSRYRPSETLQRATQEYADSVRAAEKHHRQARRRFARLLELMQAEGQAGCPVSWHGQVRLLEIRAEVLLGNDHNGNFSQAES